MSPDIGNAEVKLYPSIHTWEKNADSSPATGTVFPQVNHHFILRIEKEITFKHGAINLILGPTASGKTSILMALLGQCVPTSCKRLRQ